MYFCSVSVSFKVRRLSEAIKFSNISFIITKIMIKMDISIIKEQIIDDGVRLSPDQMSTIMSTYATEELCALAGALRKHFTGVDFDTCSIINARSGKCSEDCKWCSQSKFYHTKAEVYPLISVEQALEAAQHNAVKGVRRFSLVTSGRKVTLAEMPKVKEIYNILRDKVKIELCASMGLLNREEMAELWSCGVRRYHCNIETSASFFPMLCSTHTMEEKLQTIRHAKALGMSVCSGGIIGMGETMRDRIEMAYLLRSEGVCSIPLNVLNPIDGTPLEGSVPLSSDEVLRTFAMFRIMNPEARIRFAGGRKLIVAIQNEIMSGGADAAIVGDMLTTVGSAIDQDMKLFADLGYNTK